MALNAEALLALKFAPSEQIVNERDVMLYALSLSVARDPLNRDELPYVCENGARPLAMFPTMPVVLGHPGNWRSDPKLRVSYDKIVAGAQRLTLHKTIKPGQTIRILHQVTEIVDKGVDKGALIVLRRTIVDAASDETLASMETTSFCRADGGCGGPTKQIWQPRSVPSAAPDQTVSMPTDANAALWYRLNADRNPLHCDPDVALKAGFARPILHGLCTFGMAGLAIMRGVQQLAPDSLTSIEGRFSSPVFPGETLEVDLWQRNDGISFRVRVAERNQVALDLGFATLKNC